MTFFAAKRFFVFGERFDFLCGESVVPLFAM
jgi:hypothetical protein